MGTAAKILDVNGKKIRINNLEKVLVPASNTPKAAVIDYYIKISPLILPHLAKRPLTLKLFIDGFGHPVRYLKNAPSYTPAWVKVALVARRGGGPKIRFVLVNDLPTLVWTAAMANIEMHTFLSQAPNVDRPTMVMFDLDPGPPASVLESASVALKLHDCLSALGLESFPKSSGSKGIHVAVPLNMPVSYERTQEFARLLAEDLERKHPDLVTTRMAKELRPGKVFVDYSQNVNYKSTACVYSLRATARGVFVSMPLSWRELQTKLQARDPAAFFPTPAEALNTVQRHGDLFEPVLRLKQKLPGDTRELLQILSDLPSGETAAAQARLRSGKVSGTHASAASKLRHRR